MKLAINNQRKVRIEMLPLIDVVFLLLVFFIYAILTMSVQHGLPVDLPDSIAAEIAKNQTVSVTIKADGQIYINKLPVLPDSLEVSLKDRIKNQKNPNVLLFADNHLKYQKVFAVMDSIKKAGVRQISLQADKVGQ